MVCGILFLLPAIQRLTGLPGLPPPVTTAVLDTPLGANDGRADHLRARLTTRADGTLVVTPYQRQDSAMLRLLSEADALVLRDPHAPALPAGALVTIIRLDTLGL
jgi:molybdopterin molybdotransferase